MNITLDEIATAHSVMVATDEALGKPEREYTDEKVSVSLVEIIPDSGGSLLGFFRASKMMAELLGPNV